MDICKETVEQFIQIYEEEFGERLNVDQAQTRLRQLLGLYLVLMQPISYNEDEDQEQPC